MPGLPHWPALLPCLPCLHHDNFGFRVQGLDIGTPYAQATVRQTRSPRSGDSKRGPHGSHVRWCLRSGPISKSTQSKHSKEGGQGCTGQVNWLDLPYVSSRYHMTAHAQSRHVGKRQISCQRSARKSLEQASAKQTLTPPSNYIAEVVCIATDLGIMTHLLLALIHAMCLKLNHH